MAGKLSQEFLDKITREVANMSLVVSVRLVAVRKGWLWHKPIAMLKIELHDQHGINVMDIGTVELEIGSSVSVEGVDVKLRDIRISPV